MQYHPPWHHHGAKITAAYFLSNSTKLIKLSSRKRYVLVRRSIVKEILVTGITLTTALKIGKQHDIQNPRSIIKNFGKKIVTKYVSNRKNCVKSKLARTVVSHRFGYGNIVCQDTVTVTLSQMTTMTFSIKKHYCEKFQPLWHYITIRIATESKQDEIKVLFYH